MEKLLQKLSTWYLEKEGKIYLYILFITFKRKYIKWFSQYVLTSFLSFDIFFFFSPEAMYKSSCCLTVHAISQYSPDVLKAHAGVALPLAFLGMHQQSDEHGDGADANLWAEVWQEHVPGKEVWTSWEP